MVFFVVIHLIQGKKNSCLIFARVVFVMSYVCGLGFQVKPIPVL